MIEQRPPEWQVVLVCLLIGAMAAAIVYLATMPISGR